MKQTIQLEPLLHRQQECVAIRYAYDTALNNKVKQLRGVKWTQTHQCWYLPMEEKICKEAIASLQKLATVDTTRLKKYLHKRSNKRGKTSNTNLVLKKEKLPVVVPEKTVVQTGEIYATNAQVLADMKEHLLLKAYSTSTIRTYLNEMSQLLHLLGNVPVSKLQPVHIKKYLVYCYEQLGLSENTLHSRMNALKFYFEQVLGREKFFWEIPRPKKKIILPKVLSDVEIGRMFRALNNLKHKAILFTAYSSGLRVSEVVGIKLKDIDSRRMTIFIENAKGKKDRVVNLSPILLDILRSYLQTIKPVPKVYLFESVEAGKPYSTRSAQLIFQQAKQKAGIDKKVSFHSLRHSFATHLMEKGVDIRYIKDILGHFSIKTTERYTHVSRRALVNIESPLDDLFARGIL